MNSRPNHDPFEHLATKEALTAVATRLDATLPHLATKADVEKASNRLLMWLVGTLITFLLTFYALQSSMLDRLTAIQQQQFGITSATQREMQEQLRALAREQQQLSNELRQMRSTTDERSRPGSQESKPNR
ncbi:MAG TPA: hypothetical protein VFT37_07275 [Telluria sp.]|nr:hypothetical protein [Telluria sp.]